MGMTKFEKKVIDYIKNHLGLFFIIIISILAIAIRIKPLEFKSHDYNAFLNPWFEELKSNGGIYGLANYPGDYNAPYVTILSLLTYIPVKNIYLIKFVSIIFDFVLAISCGKLVSELTKGKKKHLEIITYGIILLFPTVIMNSSFWAQCDSIYTSFVIISLVYLMRKKYFWSFIFLGIAFSFKLQFIFILPLYIVLYFSKKDFSIFNFLIIIIVNIIMCLPAVIMGKPLIDCLMVYFNQTKTYSDYLVLNFNNLYNILSGNAPLLYNFGIIFTFSICAFTLFYCLYKKINFNNEKIIVLGLWFLIIVTYFLPGMHERYLFVGEIISVVVYIVYRRHLKLVLFINIATFINYISYLFGKNNDYMWLMSVIYFIIIVDFTREVMKVLNSKSKGGELIYEK